MKHILHPFLVISLVACATEPDALDEPVAVFAGATCGNGSYDATELCVDNPGPVVLPTGDQVKTVLVADVNADGRRDIVAITAGRVWVRYRTAVGYGNTMWLSTAGANYTDVAAADFDGDGDLDLAATDFNNDRVVVWRNTGGAVFPLWTQIAVGSEPVRVLSAHLDNNLRADLVVLSTGAHEAAVLRANGVPFLPPITYPVGDAGDIALGDCDADRRVDLMYVTGLGTATRLNARRGLGNAVLGAPLTSALPLYDVTYGYLSPYVIAADDFDNDGLDDAVVSATWSRLAPATSNGNCTFTATYTPTTMTNTWAFVRTHLRTFDWNGDGRVDLGAPHGVLGGVGDEVYSIAYGDGTGRFPTYDLENSPPDQVIPRDLAFDDANGDGHVDVLVAGDTGVYLQRRTP